MKEKTPEYFQEQKEEEKVLPRWKIGDYAVLDSNGWDEEYFIINKITKNKYGTYNANDYNIVLLRNPTQEELSIYFR